MKEWLLCNKKKIHFDKEPSAAIKRRIGGSF